MRTCDLAKATDTHDGRTNLVIADEAHSLTALVHGSPESAQSGRCDLALPPPGCCQDPARQFGPVATSPPSSKAPMEPNYRLISCTAICSAPARHLRPHPPAAWCAWGSCAWRCDVRTIQPGSSPTRSPRPNFRDPSTSAPAGYGHLGPAILEEPHRSTCRRSIASDRTGSGGGRQPDAMGFSQPGAQQPRR